MDSSPLILILATALALPPAAAIDPASARKTSESRRLDRAKAWLHDHWSQQMHALQESQSCIGQARNWSEIGSCARIAQQRARPGEIIQPTAAVASPDTLGTLEATGSH